MTDTQKTATIETLELNRETIQDLTEQEGEQARGGLINRPTPPGSTGPLSCSPTAC